MGLVTRILVLWLLAERPLHGYRIRTILAAPAFAQWFRIEDASIYSMLRSLVRQGLAQSEGEERAGKRPSRTVYRITRAGRRELRTCLETAWREPQRVSDPVNAALAAVDELEAKEIRDLLRQRLDALEERHATLQRLWPSAPSSLLARREEMLLQAEINWIRGELKSQPG